MVRWLVLALFCCLTAPAQAQAGMTIGDRARCARLMTKKLRCGFFALALVHPNQVQSAALTLPYLRWLGNEGRMT
jgi:hypothetical protein